jgi:hypothetical protein
MLRMAPIPKQMDTIMSTILNTGFLGISGTDMHKNADQEIH